MSTYFKPAIEIIKTLDNYFGLKEYFEFLYYSKLNKNKIINIPAYNADNISGESYFWNSIFKKSITDGQKIILTNFQLSSWFPRKPGLFWSPRAGYVRDIAIRRHVESRYGDGVILDVHGKTLMTELGGVGSVNFRKDRECVLVTATASGITDQGIPLMFKRNIWNKFKTELNNNIEIDIKGTLVSMPKEVDSYFFRSAGIPQYVIKVDSVLHITTKKSAVPIIVTPWTLFRSTDNKRPYGFTFVHQDIRENIIASKNWLLGYVDSHNGDLVLTDFDEELHHLNALFPLNDNVNGNITNENVFKCFQEIESKYRFR